MKQVKAKWIMKLPTTAKLKVKVGEYIGREDILAETIEYRHKSIDMSQQLAKQTEEVVSNLRQRLPLEVKAGEVLVEKKGFFGKKVVSPESGLLLRIDEFNNFVYRFESDGVRQIKSPVAGKVVKSDKLSLAIEFHARQFNGEGYGEGKRWAEGIVWVKNIGEVSFLLKDKLVMTKNFDQMLLVKSEVVGVAGFIVDRKSEIQTSLPVFVPEEGEFQKILGLENSVDKRVLLNSSDGRLMIVQ